MNVLNRQTWCLAIGKGLVILDLLRASIAKCLLNSIPMGIDCQHPFAVEAQASKSRVIDWSGLNRSTQPRFIETHQKTTRKL